MTSFAAKGDSIEHIVEEMTSLGLEEPIIRSKRRAKDSVKNLRLAVNRNGGF